MTRQPTNSSEISARLEAEGISHSVDHNGVVWIKLRDPSWIGVSPSDEQPDLWWVVLYECGGDADTVLADLGSYDWPAEEAVKVINQHRAATMFDVEEAPPKQRRRR